MKEIDLRSTFTKVYDHLAKEGQKPTNIAKQIGFTTTTQLQNVLSGKSQLSTQAIIGLIENLHVNPSFLFLSQGDMFLTEENELHKLRQEREDLLRKFGKLGDDAARLGKRAMEMERKYNDLQDITTIAIKYYKEKLKAHGIQEDEEPNIKLSE